MTSLHDAWAQGYAAAEQDALNRPYSDHPSAATWKPTANPYPRAEFSPAVKEVMRRIMLGAQQHAQELAQQWLDSAPGVYCAHPADLRTVEASPERRLICGQCGVPLSGTPLDPDVCPHPINAIHGDGTCSQCGRSW